MLIYKEELKKKEEVERLKRENYVVMKVDEDLAEHINDLREKGQQAPTLIQCTLCKELKE
jgi:vacuolar-type H+-ATPase subunit F/Vma7